MTDKKQESKYTKLGNKDYAMSPISIPLTLIPSYTETPDQSLLKNSSKQTNATSGFKIVSLKVSSIPDLEETTSFDNLNILFESWKNKTEQFVLLMEIRHNNCGFSWCDPALLSQNPEILSKLDFMKEERFMRPKYCRQRYLNISSNEDSDLVRTSHNASLISKPNALKKNVNLKKKLKRSGNKSSNFKSMLKHQPHKQIYTSSHNTLSKNPLKLNRPDKMLNAKKQNDLNISNYSSQSNPTNPLLNNPITDLIKFNEHPDDLIYNLQVLNNSSSSIQNYPTPNELINNQGSHMNANCTYYNFMPLSYTPVNYFQQTDIGIPVMIESNVESSEFSELLNCLRGENEISIENDNMFIFGTKF